MHKLIRVNKKKLSLIFGKKLLLLNIPSAAAAVALIVIVNVVMRNSSPPPELYRAVFYAAYFFTAYSFAVCFAGSIIFGRLTEDNCRHTCVEIFSDTLVVRQHEKNVDMGFFSREEFIRMWVMKLSDVEDVYAERGFLFIKGKARYFCMPEKWLRYSCGKNGRVSFEHSWNDEYGGENVGMIKFRDYYTFGERILKRIIICADKCRMTELRRAEFRAKMLKTAAKRKHRKGIAPKYNPPAVRPPREGIKKRNW